MHIMYVYISNTVNSQNSKSRIMSWYVIQWKLFPRYWPFEWGIRSPVNSPRKAQWRVALMFSLICAWVNGWVKNHEAGDLRRYGIHSVWRHFNVLLYPVQLRLRFDQTQTNSTGALYNHRTYFISSQIMLWNLPNVTRSHLIYIKSCIF